MDNDNDNDNEDIDNETAVVEPMIGMEFSSVDELMIFYANYAKQKGFAICKRSTKKVEGMLTYVLLSCNRCGMTKSESSDPFHMRPNSKTDCKAKISALYNCNGKLFVKAVELSHNHVMSPDRGHDKLTMTEKDDRNYIHRVRRLQLGEGDAMHNYFVRMQNDNSDFFYLIDLDQNGQLKNVFWADARSRAAFKEFGDVVTFDTTYLVNKYDMPFAPFIGVNHHGHSVLLGCALISSEDTTTFTWLFESWLTCMSGCPPNAIITDQDRAMKKSIENVFPNARHRWCLWHIMKKLPEKLKGHKDYKSIKFFMKNAVHDSLTTVEFEDAWAKFVERYHLESNEWLLGLYEERHRWVPAFLKDTFWAGMSTTQRSESMNSFFDNFVNSKTTLKHFVEQYENALAKKMEIERNEDFNSYNTTFSTVTTFQIEKLFQRAYTREKFRQFQLEIVGKLCCHLTVISEDIRFSEYDVGERIKLKEHKEQYLDVTFKLVFDSDTKEVRCNCRLFEFKGIMCRHQLKVYDERKIYDEVPAKYILKRWSKNVKRHTKIRIGYDRTNRPEELRYDKMCNAFSEVADVASNSEDWFTDVMTQVSSMKLRLEEKAKICGDCVVLSNTCNVSKSLIIYSKESTNIIDPSITRSKGRPPTNRRVSNVEKTMQRKSTGKKKKIDASTNMRPLTPFMGPPNMGIGGGFVFHPNMGIGGNCQFQGYQNPFWPIGGGNDMTSDTSSATSNSTQVAPSTHDLNSPWGT